MWPVYEDDSIRPHPVYKKCWFCPRCQATYTPNLTWGYRFRGNYQDTTGNQRLFGLHKKGNECPMCGRMPEGELE